jgi:hypothetical protein
MGYYIRSKHETDQATDTSDTTTDLYQYIKQHYPSMSDNSIEQSLGKLSGMFDLDTASLINMLFEERDQLKPDTDSDDTPAL